MEGPGSADVEFAAEISHLIVQESADGVIAVDEQGIVRLCNPAAAALFGRPARELLGAPFGFPIVTGRSTEVELMLPGGGIRVVEIRTVTTALHGEPLHVVALRDVTRRRHIERGAERFQRLLQPELPDLAPLEAAAVYRPAAVGVGYLGGDWYDAIPLPDGAVGAVIGDVAGHDLHAAAAMAQDIRGLEICTAEKTMERRTSCLQSNVEFLQQALTKQTRDTQGKLAQANRELAVHKTEIAALKAALATLERELAELKKSTPEKK